MKGYYLALRTLQTYIGLLNTVNRNLIFTWKLLCLTTVIICGYGAIAHFGKHPIVGVMYYMLFFDGSFIYTIMYEKGFKVPGLIAGVRNAFRARISRLRTKSERGILARQAMSVPPAGIQVGQFHMLERKSTPIFLNHVVSNVVNMLATFK